MRKIGIIILLSAIFLFSLPNAAHALQAHVSNLQDIHIKTNVQNRIIEKQTEMQQIREEKKQEIQQRLEEKRATREARREEIKQRLSERRRKIVQKFWQRMYRRFSAAISRIEKLITRIESRLAIIKKNNKDTDTKTIETEIAEAKNLLNTASASLSALNDKINTALLDSENPREDFKIVKADIIEIKDKLIKVHRILVHIIGDIKGLRIETIKTTVSPTPTQ